MAFEGLICPACSNQLDEIMLEEKMVCPNCNTNLKQKKFLAFLEFLMMNGLVQEVDFFDKKIYGEEINHTSETEEELRDETNPNEYEENRNKIEYMERTEDLNEITTDEEEFRTWDGIDEDWQEFNKKNSEKED